MKDQILIHSNYFDPHVDTVVSELAAIGLEPIRLNSQDIPVNSLIKVEAGSATDERTIYLPEGNRTIDFNRVKSFWWRRPEGFVFPKELSTRERVFAHKETLHVMQGLFWGLDCYWMNNPIHARIAESKLLQLDKAKQLGFEIPKTLVSTNPQAVREFYKYVGEQMIYKVMTDPHLAFTDVATRQPDNIFFEVNEQQEEALVTKTTLVTGEELDNLESLLIAPCLFQELIPKKLELRVTVIGNKVFGVEIHSQEHEKTKLDWRDYSVDILYRKASLPEAFMKKCLSFIQSFKLNYGALDFILSPDDRYIFLENNPSGQYQFFEDKVPELQMTKSLARCLAVGNNA